MNDGQHSVDQDEQCWGMHSNAWLLELNGEFVCGQDLLSIQRLEGTCPRLVFLAKVWSCESTRPGTTVTPCALNISRIFEPASS